jgi:hypothetical protein
MNLKAYRCTKPWHPSPCWHTKCSDCGEVLSAFDFDEESSLEIAAGDPKHDCPNPKPEQLTLA